MGFKQRSDVVQVTRLIASSPDNVLAYYKSHNLLVILIAILLRSLLSHDVLLRAKKVGHQISVSFEKFDVVQALLSFFFDTISFPNTCSFDKGRF
jgi:hypothetical protein